MTQTKIHPLKCYQHSSLTLLSSEEKGRSLFATKEIAKGELLAICPVIPIPKSQDSLLKKTLLDDYLFLWETEETVQAFCVGVISFANHSENSNTTFVTNKEDLSLSLYAKQRIGKEEEITINYDCELWFEVK